MIFFIHIPKTGGTSIYNALHQMMGDRLAWHTGPNTVPSKFFANSEVRSAVNIYGGHFGYSELKNFLDPNDKIYSVVREPVQRTFSHYNQIIVNDPKHPLHEQLKGLSIIDATHASPAFERDIRKSQCWYISGLSRFEDARRLIDEGTLRVYGMNEINLMIQDIAAQCKISEVPQLSVDNVSQNNYMNSISKTDQQFVHELTQEDNKLYEYITSKPNGIKCTYRQHDVTVTERGRMTEQELRSRANDLCKAPWHHSIQLFPDLVARGGKSPEILNKERRAILDIINLQGKSVIDIGAWNGFFSFEAKRAGAARVVATDSFAWRHPIFRGRETFDLARECLNLDVEAHEIDPTEMPGPLESADVVLFLGVFYHLLDPIGVLQKITRLARDLIVIETHQDLLERPAPGMAFYSERDRPRGSTSWWGPNPACMYGLMSTVGFPMVFYQDYPTGTRKRGIYHAFRSRATASAYMRRAVDELSLFDLDTAEGRAAVFGSNSP